MKQKTIQDIPNLTFEEIYHELGIMRKMGNVPEKLAYFNALCQFCEKKYGEFWNKKTRTLSRKYKLTPEHWAEASEKEKKEIAIKQIKNWESFSQYTLERHIMEARAGKTTISGTLISIFKKRFPKSTVFDRPIPAPKPKAAKPDTSKDSYLTIETTITIKQTVKIQDPDEVPCYKRSCYEFCVKCR